MLRENDCEEKHEEVYLRWYELLVKRALYLSGRDRASAEDLVQDVFVELALSPPDVSVVRIQAQQRPIQFHGLTHVAAPVLLQGMVEQGGSVHSTRAGVAELALLTIPTSGAGGEGYPVALTI